ncbi:MAG: hypothetical protein KGD64_00470 [Candidatus Heimdallarchaeota archaeon]|nr:hypothetical protein [Candidatus Heimdallarchaeota archaeon]
MPKKKKKKGKKTKRKTIVIEEVIDDEDIFEDYLVIVTRTERRDYHYRVTARNEEEAIEFAVDEWNPLKNKEVISFEEEFIDVIGWEASVEENN